MLCYVSTLDYTLVALDLKMHADVGKSPFPGEYL